MYLLDTNVVSELRKVAVGKADKNVVRWEASVTPTDLFLSVITIMELEQGREPHCGGGWRNKCFTRSPRAFSQSI
jgi:predicted nucleic acid-binding protein